MKNPHPSLFIGAAVLLGVNQLATAAEFSWNSSTPGADWTVAANWLVDDMPTLSIPGANDTIVNPTLFGSAEVNTNFTVSGISLTDSSWDMIRQGGNGNLSTLTINNDLIKNGTGLNKFRESPSGYLYVHVKGNVSITSGIIGIGNTSTDPSKLTVDGSVTITDGALSFRSGNAGTGSASTFQSGTIAGLVNLNGTGKLYIAGDGSTVGIVPTNTVQVGGLSSAVSTTVVANNSNNNSGYVGILNITKTSGTASYAGRIINGTDTAPNVLNVEKNGVGTQIFSGTSNTYSGTTTVNAGTLLVNGTHTGAGAYSVTGGTLGGSGSITTSTGGFMVSGGAFLQAGAGITTGDSLTLDSNLTMQDNSIITLALGNSGTHSTLARAAGTWAFDGDQSFSFTDLGAAAGTYDNIISGLTGTEAGLSTIGTWTIQNGGWVGTFAYDGSGGVDLNLSAIPEPSSALLLLGGLSSLSLLRRRKARS